MKNNKEVNVYDDYDTTSFIDKGKSKTLKDLSLKFPKEAPALKEDISRHNLEAKL